MVSAAAPAGRRLAGLVSPPLFATAPLPAAEDPPQPAAEGVGLLPALLLQRLGGRRGGVVPFLGVAPLVGGGDRLLGPAGVAVADLGRHLPRGEGLGQRR